MLNYSRQRECILQLLKARHDHPTAEMLYQDVLQEYPHISLGTVYRNLSLLADLGTIQKIAIGDGPDRFDGNPALHYHFFCESCGCVLDLDMEPLDHINKLAGCGFDGCIKGSVTHFYGTCPTCTRLVSENSDFLSKTC